jgi:epoxyqueuosine reductase QueG
MIAIDMSTMNEPAENAIWIENTVKNYIETSSDNTLKNRSDDKAFELPLVGFSKGDDPLYEAYKDYVGPFHLTPWEIFAVTFRGLRFKPEELTVVSWILPHNKTTKADNRKETFYPSERWARGRIFGEEVNEKLRKHMVAVLASKGYRVVAPSLLPQFSIRISPKYGYASTWSERHAAFASGLGTFGLCDGLITPAGKAMRTGSIIAQIQVSPTLRPYTDHHEYCLFFTQGICGKCMPRCPVGAITDAGKNKEACYKHLFSVTKEHVTASYGFDGYGCGLCQTGVPCESKIPVKQDV